MVQVLVDLLCLLTFVVLYFIPLLSFIAFFTLMVYYSTRPLCERLQCIIADSVVRCMI